MKLLTSFFILISSSLCFSQISQKGEHIYGINEADGFGQYIDISRDGNIVSVSAPNRDSIYENAGEVKVYSWNGLNWEQMGSSFLGDSLDENLGEAKLAMNGSRIVMNFVRNDDCGPDNGKLQVYDFDGTEWIQIGDDICESGGFWSSLDISEDGSTIILGEPNFNSDEGRVRVYTFDGSSWNLKGATLPGETNDRFGVSVSISEEGNRLLVGAPPAYGSPYSENGRTIVYDWSGASWETVAVFEIPYGFGKICDLSYDGTKVLTSGEMSTRLYEYSAGTWSLKNIWHLPPEEDFFDGHSYRDMKISGDGASIVFSEVLLTSGFINSYAKVWDQKPWGWSERAGSPIYTEFEFEDFGSVAISYDGTTFCLGTPDASVGNGHTRVFESPYNVGLEHESATAIELFPNPCSDFLQLDLGDTEVERVGITNLLGEIVMETDQIENKMTLDLTTLENGVYLVNIHSGQNTIVRKIVLER